MLYVAIVVLSFALVVVWTKLRGHHRALAELRESIERRQPFLRHEHPGASGKEWDALCAATNELLQTQEKLQQTQSGQLTQLEATLGSLKEAVLIVDRRNHIILANNALQEIFPNAVQIIDQRLEVVLHSVAFLNFVETVRAGEAEPQFPIEFIEGGETRWVEVTGSTIPPLDGGKGMWALFVLHDITRQKRLELIRKEFVANVSHELRTPLSVIKGYVETLVDGHHTMEEQDRTRFLATINRHTERLNSLLEDLLTLSRLESINPGLSLESTDISQLIDGIVDDYRSRPAAKEHEIVLDSDLPIKKLLLDPLKITQVFANLLDNALKYTPPKTRITISVKLSLKEVAVTLRDNGPGIPEADLPHIFERFYRVEKGRSRERGGTGLGLSIAKHIIQLHGSNLRVESSVGQGTTFAFNLPLTTDH